MHIGADVRSLGERLERQLHARSMDGRGYVAGLVIKEATPSGNEIRIKGYASTPELDRHEDEIPPQAFAKHLHDYLQRNPILLAQHNHDWPIGRCVDAKVTDQGLWVEDVIPSSGKVTKLQEEYATLIEQGVLRTLSIGGIVHGREWIEGEEAQARGLMEFRRLTVVELAEHSVVSVPSNRGSVFSLVGKSAGGTALRHHPARIARALEQVRRGDAVDLEALAAALQELASGLEQAKAFTDQAITLLQAKPEDNPDPSEEAKALLARIEKLAAGAA